MQVDHAWRAYLAASHGFAAASERLSDRLRFIVNDPPSAPQTLSPEDAEAWLALMVDVEQAAAAQCRALREYIKARNTPPP